MCHSLHFQELFPKDFLAVMKWNGLLSRSSEQLVSGHHENQLNSTHVSTSCLNIIRFNYIIQFIPLCLKLLLPFATLSEILTRVFMSLQTPSSSCLQSGPCHRLPLRVSFDQKPVHVGFMVNNLLPGHFCTISPIYHRAANEAVSCNKSLKKKIVQNCIFRISWHFDHLKPNDIFYRPSGLTLK